MQRAPGPLEVEVASVVVDADKNKENQPTRVIIRFEAVTGMVADLSRAYTGSSSWNEFDELSLGTNPGSLTLN